MPTGTVMQARPRTLRRISTFFDALGNYDAATHEATLTANGLSVTELVSTDNQYSSNVLEQFLPRNNEVLINHVYQQYDNGAGNLFNNLNNNQPVAFSNPAAVPNHMDGILRDNITDDLFNFLAIGIDRVDQIIEGSIVQYNREFSGVYEVILHDNAGGVRNDRTSITRYLSVFRVVSL